MGMDFLKFVVGVPVAFLVVYVIARVGTSGVLKSIQEWQERKKK